MNREQWVSLPIEQATLKHLEFSGFGKRSEAYIKTVGKPALLVPTQDLRISISPKLEAKIHLRSLNDSDLEHTLEWPKYQVPKLDVAIINWQTSLDEWHQWLYDYHQTDSDKSIELDMYVELVLQLGPQQSRKSTQQLPPRTKSRPMLSAG